MLARWRASYTLRSAFSNCTGLTSGSVKLDSALGQCKGLVGLSLPPKSKEREVPVYNLDFEQVSTTLLPDDVFHVPVRPDILHRVVRWQRAKKQQGTHKAKGRSEVSGGGRKPWNQKGTGRARQGSIRAPQFRGGGVVHGPVNRSHAFDLPKKVRRMGLKCALSARTSEQRLLIMDSLLPAESKTKVLEEQLERFFKSDERRSALLIDSGKLAEDGGEALRRATRNLPGIDVLPSEGLNVYSILRRSHLIVTQNALSQLLDRLRTPIFRGPLDRKRWQALLDAQSQLSEPAAQSVAQSV